MPSYKLTYYNATWYGEPIRFLFKHQGVHFDDVRHTVPEFEKIKTKFPLQRLPTLEVDGKVLFQNVAIGRYLANKFELAGANEDEKVAIDIVVDSIVDLRTSFICVFDLKGEERAAKIKEIVTGDGKLLLTYLNEQVTQNGGYFVSGKLTWPDLFFSADYDIFVKYLGADIIEKFPALVELNKKVRALPNIKKWIELRPSTED